MILLAGAVLACTAMASEAKAILLSELLEKGHLHRGNGGRSGQSHLDLRRGVAKAKADNLLAARAQFNIGQCLTKKGKKAEATAAFEKLIKDYPTAKELVAKARKFVPSGLPLGPVPWSMVRSCS